MSNTTEQTNNTSPQENIGPMLDVLYSAILSFPIGSEFTEDDLKATAKREGLDKNEIKKAIEQASKLRPNNNKDLQEKRMESSIMRQWHKNEINQQKVLNNESWKEKTSIASKQELVKMLAEGDVQQYVVEDKKFIMDNSFNGIRAIDHITYKHVESLSKTITIDNENIELNYEFLVEYKFTDPTVGIYYGCRVSFGKLLEQNGNNNQYKKKLKNICSYLDKQWEDNKEKILWMLDQTCGGGLKFDKRWKFTDNTNDCTYWPFWFHLYETEDLKFAFKQTNSIQRAYKVILDKDFAGDQRKRKLGELYKDVSCESIEGGQNKYKNNRTDQSATADWFTKDALTEFKAILHYNIEILSVMFRELFIDELLGENPRNRKEEDSPRSQIQQNIKDAVDKTFGSVLTELEKFFAGTVFCNAICNSTTEVQSNSTEEAKCNESLCDEMYELAFRQNNEVLADIDKAIELLSTTKGLYWTRRVLSKDEERGDMYDGRRDRKIKTLIREYIKRLYVTEIKIKDKDFIYGEFANNFFKNLGQNPKNTVFNNIDVVKGKLAEIKNYPEDKFIIFVINFAKDTYKNFKIEDSVISWASLQRILLTEKGEIDTSLTQK